MSINCSYNCTGAVVTDTLNTKYSYLLNGSDVMNDVISNLKYYHNAVKGYVCLEQITKENANNEVILFGSLLDKVIKYRYSKDRNTLSQILDTISHVQIDELVMFTYAYNEHGSFVRQFRYRHKNNLPYERSQMIERIPHIINNTGFDVVVECVFEIIKKFYAKNTGALVDVWPDEDIEPIEESSYDYY